MIDPDVLKTKTAQEILNFGKKQFINSKEFADILEEERFTGQKEGRTQMLKEVKEKIEKLRNFIIVRQVTLRKKYTDVWVEGKLDGFREVWEETDEILSSLNEKENNSQNSRLETPNKKQNSDTLRGSNYVSKCCKADIHKDIEDEGTFTFVCNKCGKDCDIVLKEPVLCKNCGHSELIHHRRKLGKCVFKGCKCKKFTPQDKQGERE